MNALLPRLAEHLRKLSPARTIALGVVCLLVVAALDNFTPPGMSFSLFYLLGIGLVAWGAGRGPAICLALLAAASAFCAEYHAGAGKTPACIVAWNSLSRLVVFLSAAGLVAEMGRLTKRLGRLVEERTAQWQAEAQRHEATSARLSELVERFEQIAENIQEVFWLFDPKAQRFLYISPAFERIWGRKQEELYATPHVWETSLHPEDRARLVGRPLAEKVSSPYEAEYRVVRPDGSVRWIRDRAFPIRNPQGEVQRIAGLAQDITERKRVEEALRRSQRALGEAMDQARLANWEYDVVTGLFTFDDRFFRLYGTSAEREGGYQMSPETYEREFLLPEDARLVTQRIAAAIATTEANFTYQVEHRIRRRDGQIRHLVVRVAVVKDAAGQTIKTRGVNQDITELKQAEQERSEALELNRMLIEASTVGIAAYKASGQCIFVNEALARIVGGSAEQLLTQNFRSLSSWQNSSLLESADATLRTGQPRLCEFHGPSTFGKVFWISFSFAPFTNQGQPHLLLMASDITERKRAEQRLADALDLNQKILAASLVGMAAYQASGECVFANEALARIAGGSVAAILQGNFRQLEGWRRSGLLAAAEAALRTKSVCSGEFCDSTRFGKTVWVDAHLIPFVSANQQHLLIMCYDISERKQSERQVLEISDREQARIGQDLHDGLCQQLVSLAFDANALVGQLEPKGSPATALARRIADLLDQSITEARNVSRGLFPVRLETDGLLSAFEELAKSTSQRYRVHCQFTGHAPSGLGDQARSIHLFRIVQEAVNNALKHAQPKSIRIELHSTPEQLELKVTDDGFGFPASAAQPRGLGLPIMEYRARSLGGTLQVGPGPGGGTTVCCCIPRRPASNMTV